jgi:hypothetical protein
MESILGPSESEFPFLRPTDFGRRLAFNPFRGEWQGEKDE